MNPIELIYWLVDGVDFEKGFDKRMNAEFEGLNINFLSLDDLIKAKKNAGRLQDLADAEQLSKLKEKKSKK